jgi:hypothetical protein
MRDLREDILMTDRTVPLGLLVRVREALNKIISADCTQVCCNRPQWNGDPASMPECCGDPDIEFGQFSQLVHPILAELTAQIEQQRQGEPVAWIYAPDMDRICSGTPGCYDVQLSTKPTRLKTVPLYAAPPATPQDSVPAWAWRQAFDEWKFDMNIPIAKGADWIESRALALAQTKDATPSGSGNSET